MAKNLSGAAAKISAAKIRPPRSAASREKGRGVRFTH